jgi:hypothetical protein
MTRRLILGCTGDLNVERNAELVSTLQAVKHRTGDGTK